MGDNEKNKAVYRQKILDKEGLSSWDQYLEIKKQRATANFIKRKEKRSGYNRKFYKKNIKPDPERYEAHLASARKQYYKKQEALGKTVKKRVEAPEVVVRSGEEYVSDELRQMLGG